MIAALRLGSSSADRVAMRWSATIARIHPQYGRRWCRTKRARGTEPTSDQGRAEVRAKTLIYRGVGVRLYSGRRFLRKQNAELIKAAGDDIGVELGEIPPRPQVQRRAPHSRSDSGHEPGQGGG